MSTSFKEDLKIFSADLKDYPLIQNMAQFYVYDASRVCGFSLSEKGLYEPKDYQSYLIDPSKKAYLIKVADEIAGFVLLAQKCTDLSTCWNIDQFFIVAKFQGQGIGAHVARQIWNMYPGLWKISVLPDNKSALSFWQKIINAYSEGNFSQEIKWMTTKEDHKPRIIFTFNIVNKNKPQDQNDIVVRLSKTSDISSFIALSYKKRRAYETAQPQFWKYAGPLAERSQVKWFTELLAQEDHIIFTAEENGKITGFIIGKLISAPEVYDPGGLTLMIDDFCVENETKWNLTGRKLMEEIQKLGKIKGASQILVVCGAHDVVKRRFLGHMGLCIASEWYIGEIV